MVVVRGGLGPVYIDGDVKGSADRDGESLAVIGF